MCFCYCISSRDKKIQFSVDSESLCTQCFLNWDLVRLGQSEQKKFFHFDLFFNCLLFFFPPLSNMVDLDVVLFLQLHTGFRISCFGYNTQFLGSRLVPAHHCSGLVWKLQKNVCLFMRTKWWWRVLLFRLLTARNRSTLFRRFLNPIS